MKPIYQCDFCKALLPKEKCEQHKGKCLYNPKNESCYTCANAAFNGILPYCKIDNERAFETYPIVNCGKWKYDKWYNILDTQKVQLCDKDGNVLTEGKMIAEACFKLPSPDSVEIQIPPGLYYGKISPPEIFKNPVDWLNKQIGKDVK